MLPTNPLRDPDETPKVPEPPFTTNPKKRAKYKDQAEAALRYQIKLAQNRWIDEKLKELLPKEIYELQDGTTEGEQKVRDYCQAQKLFLGVSECGLVVFIAKDKDILFQGDFRELLKKIE